VAAELGVEERGSFLPSVVSAVTAPALRGGGEAKVEFRMLGIGAEQLHLARAHLLILPRDGAHAIVANYDMGASETVYLWLAGNPVPVTPDLLAELQTTNDLAALAATGQNAFVSPRGGYYRFSRGEEGALLVQRFGP
jgi:hypothetical protein